MDAWGGRAEVCDVVIEGVTPWPESAFGTVFKGKLFFFARDEVLFKLCFEMHVGSL